MPSCAPTDLVCSVADGTLTLNWSLESADCRCQVRDATGGVVGTPASGVTTFEVPCTSLGSPTGTLEVACMDSRVLRERSVRGLGNRLPPEPRRNGDLVHRVLRPGPPGGTPSRYISTRTTRSMSCMTSQTTMTLTVSPSDGE